MATLKTVPARSCATRSASVRTTSRKRVAALPISERESLAPEPATQGSPRWSAASTARSLVAALRRASSPSTADRPSRREEDVPARPLDRAVVGMRRDHGTPHRRHPVDHLLDGPRGGSEELGGSRHPFGVGEEGQVVTPVGGDLRAAERQEILGPGGLPDLGEPVQAVHVGEDHAVEPRLPGAADHVEGRERAARRVPAVDVQVDEHGISRDSNTTRIAKGSTRRIRPRYRRVGPEEV